MRGNTLQTSCEDILKKTSCENSNKCKSKNTMNVESTATHQFLSRQIKGLELAITSDIKRPSSHNHRDHNVNNLSHKDRMNLPNAKTRMLSGHKMI